MSLVQNQKLAEALFPRGAHPPFGKGVGIRRLERRVDDANALGLEDGVQGSGELAVIVVNQEPFVGSDFLKRPRDLSGLLGDPLAMLAKYYTVQVSSSMKKST